jgi:hypothetical protein
MDGHWLSFTNKGSYQRLIKLSILKEKEWLLKWMVNQDKVKGNNQGHILIHYESNTPLENLIGY